jgi:RNA-splicing ligase RtcB
MTRLRDPQTCRRALREIGEIAAVAGLEGGQMTDQEALQSIAAIAEWVIEEAPGARADCGEVVRRLERMTAGVDFEALGDREAQALFGDVLGVLEAAGAGRE